MREWQNNNSLMADILYHFLDIAAESSSFFGRIARLNRNKCYYAVLFRLFGMIDRFRLDITRPIGQ